jgi:hypothetical protein
MKILKTLLKLYIAACVVVCLPIVLGKGRKEANAHPELRPSVGPGTY